MKCARCGHDVPGDAPRCPYCAAGAPPAPPEEPPRQDNRARCPVCGSTNLHAVRRNYSPGCGCLGLLLFSWVGLLLGLLGAGQVDMVCGDCGASWPAGKPGRANRGCLASLFPIVLILLIIWLMAK